MRKLVSVAEHILFCLNVLMIFLLVFENQLLLPSWLQVIGRMHPMFLHFPIVILLLAGALYLFRSYDNKLVNENIVSAFILLGALTSAITIIMGLFLSREGGYTGGIVLWHKWLGIAVGVLSSLWYYIVAGNYPIKLGILNSGLIVVSLLFAGHLGSELTHGEDFLFAPVRRTGTSDVVPFGEALIYDHVISAIVNEKCASCHNPDKAKGNLVMTSQEGIAKGGKTGKLFEAGKPNESLLMKRIHLPLEDKKHMPPKNKSQLTETEEEILRYWIKSGGDFRKKIIDFPPGDTLRTLLEQRIQPSEQEEVYTFAPADEKTVKKLNTAYRVVAPLSRNSPALFVNIYNAASYTSKQLEELSIISPQIVSLDLTKMPVTDGDLKLINKFENLRRLNLNFTNVTDAGLPSLSALENLEYLSLSSTKITAAKLSSLSGLKNLHRLYIWNTSLSKNDIEKLKGDLDHVVVETGFMADHSKVLRLPPARIENDKKIYSDEFLVTIAHPVKGVTLRYTLDGSDPDSINSPVYEGPVKSSTPVTSLKVRAYKDGWYGSDVTAATFYKTSFKPDTIILITLPDKKYMAKLSETLIDGESGDVNYGSREGWLGYRQDRMEAVIEFGTAVELESVILSTNNDPGAFIFPAQKIQLWGGRDKDHVVLLSTLSPAQPDGYNATVQKSLICSFKRQPLSYLRIVADPLPRLPSWHSNKGEKGWLFVDEILFN